MDKQIIIVAASDSSEEDKLIADYICDGINDEVEITQAMNMGYPIRFLPGIFYPDDGS